MPACAYNEVGIFISLLLVTEMIEMIEVVLDSEETIEDHAKCTKQLVETVVMNVKYHLSLVMIDQFTVLIVSKIIDKTS